MKRTKFLLASLLMAGLMFTSCKNETQTTAEKTVDVQTTYVDSVTALPEADAKANWTAIDAAYQQRLMEAEAAVANTSDQAKAQEKLDKAKMKYDELKAKFEAEMAPVADTSMTAGTPAPMDDAKAQALRDKLFGPGNLKSDMSFAWVTKANILSVYEKLAISVDQNRKNFDGMDADMAKQYYKGLNDRKDVLDKEGTGLDGKDNLKIAAIKTKLAPVLALDQATKK